MTIDPGADPDRYDPTHEVAPVGPLHPEDDPDRFHNPTLPGLLGDGAHEDERNNWQWVIGLASMFAFLIFISLLVRLGNGG